MTDLKVIHHFHGSCGSRLHLMQLEAWSTSMSTLKHTMSTGISRQATSYLMVPSGPRFQHIRLNYFYFNLSERHCISQGSVPIDFRFWIGKTGWQNRRGRSYSNKSCWYIWLSSTRVSKYTLRQLLQSIIIPSTSLTFHHWPCRYLSDGLATTKSDVYAFGVVLFEIISGKEAIIRTEGAVTKNPERRSLASTVSFASIHLMKHNLINTWHLS